MSCCQSLGAFSTAQSVTNAFGARAPPDPLGELQRGALKMTDKNYGIWKMQDWKMTDKLLAKCEHNYGVWKMQDWKTF